MTGPSGDKGFTLMEVVVAVAIMGLVMATIGTAFRQLSNGAHRLEETGDDNLALGEAIRWIGRDLEGLYVDQAPLFTPGETTDDPDPYRFTLSRETVGGEEMSILRFTTLNHLPFGGSSLGGIAEVVYFVTEEKGETRLRRSDRLFFHDPFEPAEGHPVMMNRLTAFTVVCIDTEGQEQETWDSDNDAFERATPVAVKVTLSREGASGGPGHTAEVLIPLRSRRKEALDG